MSGGDVDCKLCKITRGFILFQLNFKNLSMSKKKAFLRVD